MKTHYSILNNDIYDVDKNRYKMNIMVISKVIFSKYQKLAFINQIKIWKWLSTMETNSGISKQIFFLSFRKEKDRKMTSLQ